MIKNNLNWLSLEKLDDKKGLILVIITWISVNLLLYIALGFQTGLESKKYIQEAENLYNQNGVSQLRYYFYFSIISLIYVAKILGQDIYFGIYLQLIISLLAHIYFYKSLSSKKSIGVKNGLLALTIIMTAPSFEYWNLTLYSESLFFSFILFFFATCIRYKPISFKTISLQATLLSCCIISRPLGILLILPWIFFIVLCNFKKWSTQIIVSTFLIGTLTLIIIANFILGSIGDWDVIDPFSNGYIICGIPSLNPPVQISLQSKTPIGQLIELLINEPKLFLSQCLNKIFAFFSQYRNYYSLTHNTYICIYSLLTFSLLIYQLIKKGMKQPIIKMCLLIILFWMTSILLQCDDYHSRFYSALIPAVALLCIGIKEERVKLTD